MISIYNSDCLEKLPELETNSIDLVLVDLPYGTTKIKWDVIIPFDAMWNELNRICKERCAMVFFCGQPFTSQLITSNIKHFKYCWVWDKVTARGHLVAKKRPMAQHEDIAVFYRKAPTYNPQMIQRPPDKVEYRNRNKEYSRSELCGGKLQGGVNAKVYNKWYPKTIITESKASNKFNKFHPTAKPIPLLEYLVKTYSNEGDTVLDFTMGSGSTGVASVNLDRDFIGIELNEDYYSIAVSRINEASNNKLKDFKEYL